MACRDIPTEGVLEQERSRVSDKGTPSAKKEESRGGRECPISAMRSMATFTLEAQEKDGILKEAIWLDECTAKAESSEDLRSIKKIHRAYAELLSTSALTSSPRRPGDMSVPTDQDTSKSSRCQCSSDMEITLN